MAQDDNIRDGFNWLFAMSKMVASILCDCKQIQYKN